MASDLSAASLHIQNITKRFGNRTLFEGLSLTLTPNTRLGLIGRNGCGKSTLMKIILGEEGINDGAIKKPDGLRINYLSQDPKVTPGVSLIEEVRSVFTEVNSLLDEEAALITQLESGELDNDGIMDVAEKLDTVNQRIEQLDGHNIEARVSAVLKGLGFTMDDYDRQTTEFSGGWQMRISLAKILLEQAEILLMDEPTNHLDMETVEWLESYLKTYPGGLLIISHDRRFLDQVTKETAELNGGQLRVWAGNYTQFVELKAAEMEQLAAAVARQEKEIAKQIEFVQRFKASAARGTQAKSREKQLAKIKRIHMPQDDTRKMSMTFPMNTPSGQHVAQFKNVSMAYGDKKLFHNVSTTVEREQCIFILGGNGVGKTTLMRLIMDIEKPTKGTIQFGHQVSIGYFSQNQLDTLEADKTVFETMNAVCPDMDDTEQRKLLGRFLFTGEQVFKPVSILSGGEKSKLAFAKLMMQGHNTLLLDEPTNHMDIPSKEVIADALADYEGTVLCISHDRYFIQELATEIWEVYNGELIVYCGDYDYYLSKRDELREQVDERIAKHQARIAKQHTQQNNSETSPSHEDAKQLKKGLRRVEKEILDTEKAIEAKQAEMVTLSDGNNVDALTEANKQLKALEAHLSALNSDWEELAEQVSVVAG